MSSLHFVDFRSLSSQLIFKFSISVIYTLAHHTMYSVLCSSFIAFRMNAYSHNSRASYAQKMKQMKRKLTHCWKRILLECRISQSSKNLFEKLRDFSISFKNIYIFLVSRSHSRYACFQHFSPFLYINFVGCFSAFIIWFVRFVIRFHLINIIMQRSIHFVTLSLQTNLAKNGTTQKKIPYPYAYTYNI